MYFDDLVNFHLKRCSTLEEVKEMLSQIYIRARLLTNIEVFYFLKNNQIPHFMWSRQVCTELFVTDRQTDGRTEEETDMEKLTVGIGNFAKAPKILVNYRHINLFCKLHFQSFFPISIDTFLLQRYVDKYTGVAVRMIIRMFIRSSFCVFSYVKCSKQNKWWNVASIL
jgi:hypothetical protein